MCSSDLSLRTLIAKTLLEPTRKRSMLKQPVLSAISWNRAIENSSKDHLYRENSVMPNCLHKSSSIYYLIELFVGIYNKLEFLLLHYM